MDIRTARALLVAFLASGCASEPEPPPIVTVIAHDYAFQGPAEIPSGMVTFRMVNRANRPHMVAVHRIVGNHTLAELLDHIRAKAWEPDWAPLLGGPNSVGTGDTSNATIRLEPGRYVLLCWVEESDKQLHIQKGMAAETRATTKAITLTEPVPDVIISLADYRIDLDAPAKRGERVFKVVNNGTQQHDVEILRLAPGVTTGEALLAFEGGRPPTACT